MSSSPAVIDSILARRSIRRYQSTAIPPATLTRLVQAATAAPSAHNRQPWRFIVLSTSEDKETLATAMGDRLRQDRTRDGDDPSLIDADVTRSQARLTQAPTIIVVAMTQEDMDRYPDARRAEAAFDLIIPQNQVTAENFRDARSITLMIAQLKGVG